MTLTVHEAGDLPYGDDLLDDDGVPAVLLRGDRDGVRGAAAHLYEEVAVVPRGELDRLLDIADRAQVMAWRPTNETPPPRRPCVLLYDTAGRDVDMSEALTIGWHDGERWYDVHGAAADPDAWLIGWLLLPVAEAAP